MESTRSTLHSQRSALEERDTFLYLALGLVSVARFLLHRLGGPQALPAAAPRLEETRDGQPPRLLLR
jgi:hypothetical protein